MKCIKPLSAFQSGPGIKPYFSKEKRNPSDRSIQFPCGQCRGCRLKYSRDWAIRIIHETTLHEQNSFLTLTYNEENYPQYGSLQKSHFQSFMRRFRKYVKRHDSKKIRFFHCGEYGERMDRPHYHAIIFNYDFPDKVLYSEKEGNLLYTSDTLSSLWGKGFCTIGDVTFESASYVARYVTKKQIISEKSPDHVKLHYTKTDPITGEIHEIQPEYVTMSRKPGIAYDWFQKWKSDVFPSDEITHKGRVLRTPSYYDKLFDAIEPGKLKEVKSKRLENARKNRKNYTPERLHAYGEILKAKSNLNSRSYENEN